MSLTQQMRRAAAGVSAGGGGFDPEADITWHSLFWAEGTAFQAEGYADGANVTTWPNETAEADATQAVGTKQPTYDAVNADFAGQPAVAFDGGDVVTALGLTSVSQPYTVVAVYKAADVWADRTLFDSDYPQPIVLSTKGNRSVSIVTAAAQLTSATYTNGEGAVVLGRFSFNSSSSSIHIDEAGIATGNAGIQPLVGSVYVGARDDTGAIGSTEPIALLGIYDGDITADGAWADFKTWVEDHYGLSIA